MRPSSWVVGIASVSLACGSSSQNEAIDAGGDASAPVDAGLDAVTESAPSSDAMSPSNAWAMGYYPSWD